MPQQLTAFGRIVWGHPGKPRPKINDETKQPVLKDGQPVQQWQFGLAIEKAATMQARGCSQEQIAAQSFDYAVWPFFDAEAKTGFPNGTPPDFSWKFKDGDSMDRAGKPYADREGYKGHWVLAISTEAFAPALFRFDGQAYQAITPDQLKTGDYVSVSLNLKLNIPQNRNHKPGIYVNPNGICFAGHGQEIFNGPDAQTMFGGMPQFALPPGASTSPMMPVGAPGMPQQPMQQPMGGGMPQQPMQQPMGGMPGQQPMQQPQPMGGMPGQQPMQQPQPMGSMPGQQPMQQPQPMGSMPPPAPDFIPGAGQQPMQQQPMGGGMPGMMPGMMPPR